MRVTCLSVLTIAAVLGLCACRRSPDTARAATSSDVLVHAAQETHVRYVRALNAGDEARSDAIPERYWADAIRALKPVKVYTHRANIVVVQRVHGHLEEGKYIYIPISSFLPQEGVDGFSFTPNPQTGGAYDIGNGVFDYQRPIQQGALRTLLYPRPTECECPPFFSHPPAMPLAKGDQCRGLGGRAAKPCRGVFDPRGSLFTLPSLPRSRPPSSPSPVS